MSIAQRSVGTRRDGTLAAGAGRVQSGTGALDGPELSWAPREALLESPTARSSARRA